MLGALLTILSTLDVQKSTEREKIQPNSMTQSGKRWFSAQTHCLPSFCAGKKYVYKSTVSSGVKVLAHNLIHIICAEHRRRATRHVAHPSETDFSSLPAFYASRNYPYKSRLFLTVKILAHSLIHKRCAERRPCAWDSASQACR